MNDAKPSPAFAFHLVDGPADSDETAIPDFLRARPPAVSDLICIDERVALPALLKALAEAGFSTVNTRDGRLAITCSPQDFRS